MQSAFARSPEKSSIEEAEAAIVRAGVENQPPEEGRRPGLACGVHVLQVQLWAGDGGHVSGRAA